MKKILKIVGIIFVVIIVLGIISSLGKSGNNSSNNTNNAATTASSNNQPKSIAKIGEPVQDGDLMFTATEVSTAGCSRKNLRKIQMIQIQKSRSLKKS